MASFDAAQTLSSNTTPSRGDIYCLDPRAWLSRGFQYRLTTTTTSRVASSGADRTGGSPSDMINRMQYFSRNIFFVAQVRLEFLFE